MEKRFPLILTFSPQGRRDSDFTPYGTSFNLSQALESLKRLGRIGHS